MRQIKGFTLIELMVVVAIVAIIAAIAIPSYQSQVRKSRRADATSNLGDIQLRQERWRAERATYGTLVELGLGATPVTTAGHYNLSMPALSGNCPNSSPVIAAATSNSYILQAAAVGAQAADTACATMQLRSFCGTITRTPAGCW